MKTNTILLALFILTNSICKSQITPDYPFKTYLDSANNLYVTGYQLQGNTNEIYTAKYPPNNDPNPYWERTYPNPFGDDRGLDLAVDIQGNTYVTGYIYNNITNSNDIITLKYNSAGIIQWNRIYKNGGDDKGMGIDLSYALNIVEEIFITGYITGATTGKDLSLKNIIQ
ncbi:MAG: hypothetical protein M3R36_09470 [Bacteroidota bacterium]|nr:hypothetical protein [Bacteroidota bacterium]